MKAERLHVIKELHRSRSLTEHQPEEGECDGAGDDAGGDDGSTAATRRRNQSGPLIFAPQGALCFYVAGNQEVNMKRLTANPLAH